MDHKSTFLIPLEGTLLRLHTCTEYGTAEGGGGDENVPDMAIFTPVQTTTIAASPRHSVLPAARTTGPFVR